MPPLNTWEAPERSVSRLAMRPPVQLSAVPKVSPFSFKSSSTTNSREGTSTPYTRGPKCSLSLSTVGRSRAWASSWVAALAVTRSSHSPSLA